MDALTVLLRRQSCHALQEPAPSGEALETILQAACRVPDFQHLRPWEFILAAGEGRERLGKLWQDVARAENKSEKTIQRCLTLPQRAPLVVTVLCRHRHSEIVTAFEQQLSAGCAVMAMQMAAFALGFGGVWRSGWLMESRVLHERLGLEELDRIVGFLYLGTPARPLPPLAEAPSLTEGGVVRWF